MSKLFLKENRKYLVVLICCLLLVCGMIGGANLFGLFYDSLQEKLQINKATATLHMTISSLVSGLAMPVASILYSKFGNKKIVALGAFLFLATGIGIGLSKSVLLINILGFFRGLGYCFCNFLIVTITINNWFLKDRGKLIGIIFCGSGIFGTIMSPVLGVLIQKTGFTISYILFVTIIVALIIPYILFCPFKPEEINMRPYGYGETLEISKKEVGNNNYKLLSSLFVAMVVYAIVTQAMAAAAPHFSSHASNIGLANMGTSMVSLSMAGNIIMKLVIGILIDKIGIFNAAFIMICTSSASLLTITLTTSPILLGIASFTFGAGFAVNTVGLSALVSAIYTEKDYSIAYAQVNLVSNISNALLLLIIAALYDGTGSFKTPYLIIICLQVIDLVLLTLFKKNKKERI